MIVNPVEPNDHEIPTDSNASINTNVAVDTNNTQPNSKELHLVNKLLGHNSYIYDHNVRIVSTNGQRIVLKKGKNVKVYYNAITINGKRYYRIGKDKFIKVANIGIKTILTHNLFVYNRKGKHTKKLLRKNAKITVLDDGQRHLIKGKSFYRIGKNQYIRVQNVAKFDKNR